MVLFDWLKKKNKKSNPHQQEKAGSAAIDKEMYERIANQCYPGLGIYVRDVNLPEALCERYKDGMLICERGFTDASNRVMGMVTTHRYMILSNHMANISMFEHGTNWGLHVAQSGSHFKVLGKYKHNDKTAIILLHLPDGDDWKVYKSVEFSMDNQVYQMAVQRFVAKCDLPPIPELTTSEWLIRCAAPLGMNEQGVLFDL